MPGATAITGTGPIRVWTSRSPAILRHPSQHRPRGVWTPPQLQLVNRPQPALRQSLSCDDPKVKVVLSEDELVCSDAVEVDLEAGVWPK
jgi:hypothetical protein